MIAAAIPGISSSTVPRVVVVGAGFAGMELTKRLRNAPARITLIDQHNYHLFQPLLYQAATTVLAPSEIAWPIREIFRDRDDVEVVLDAVTGIDRTARRVLLASGGRSVSTCWSSPQVRRMPILDMPIGSASRLASKRSTTPRRFGGAFCWRSSRRIDA